jgi:hypothetical protein
MARSRAVWLLVLLLLCSPAMPMSPEAFPLGPSQSIEIARSTSGQTAALAGPLLRPQRAFLPSLDRAAGAPTARLDARQRAATRSPAFCPLRYSQVESEALASEDD